MKTGSKAMKTGNKAGRTGTKSLESRKKEQREQEI